MKSFSLALIVIALIAADFGAAWFGFGHAERFGWSYADSLGLVYAGFYFWRERDGR